MHAANIRIISATAAALLFAACETIPEDQMGDASMEMDAEQIAKEQEDITFQALLELYKIQSQALLEIQKHMMIGEGGRKSAALKGCDSAPKKSDKMGKKQETQKRLAKKDETPTKSASKKSPKDAERTITQLQLPKKPSRDPFIPIGEGERKTRVWPVKEGDTLHSTFEKWGEQAEWKVIWRAAYEYPIEADAAFSGDFPEAVQQLLEALQDNNPPVYATFYKNRVAVIRNYEGDY